MLKYTRLTQILNTGHNNNNNEISKWILPQTTQIKLNPDLKTILKSSVYSWNQ